MSEVKNVLKQLIVDEEAIAIYLHLLESGGGGVQTIARETKLHRPRVYKALESLREARFIEIKSHGKRVKYIAAEPYILMERVKEIESKVHKVLPKLQRIKEKNRAGIGMDVLDGESGLAACFLDVVSHLKKEDTFYRISSAKDQQFVDSTIPKEYREIRDRKKLERRVITSNYVSNQKKPRLERSIRNFDEQDELFEHNVIQFIYGDKVSLLDFNSLTGTIIQNQAIADFQRSIFLTLYKRLPAQ